MKYNEILVSLRKAKGKSRKEVAEAIGTSVSAIAMYERGERVPKDDIKSKIAAYYRKSVSSIFFAG
jgi:transcriptional regulator with XRE-family HTH domain